MLQILSVEKTQHLCRRIQTILYRKLNIYVEKTQHL